MDIVMIIETIFRWICMLCILSGMMYLSHKKLQIEIEFVSIYVFSSIAVIIFICGIFGILLQGLYIVCGFGLCSFIYMIKKITTKGISPLKEYFKRVPMIYIIFCIGAVSFLLQLLATSLVHYDNYSHWAVVVKEMLITKAFPTAESVMIEFKNYPLGMSSFIYFVCEILGYDESKMLFAQGLVIFSCFFAIFGIIKEKKRLLLYVFLVTGFSILSIFNIAIRINNLLVDFILPMLALAIIAVIYHYRLQIHKIYIVTCPIIGLLVIVKNTGIIYAVFGILYLFYVLIKYKTTYTKNKMIQIEGVLAYNTRDGIILFFKTMAFLVASTITTALWNIHMKYAFVGIESKFELEADKMQSIYAGKTLEDVNNIVELFLNTITDITSRSTIGIILFELLAITFCIVGVVILKRKWMLPKLLISLNVMLILYYAGILAMYVFSMPLDEALYLAGFERYASSIVIFFGGAITMCATIDMENSFYYQIGNEHNYRAFKSIQHKKMYNLGIVICVSITLLILSSEFNGLAHHVAIHEETLPSKVKTVVGDSWNEEVDNNRYLVYASDNNSQVTNYYLQYLTKYYLRADQVDGICYFYEDNMLNLLSQYDKLIIIESDAEQQALMQKYLQVSGDVGVYSLHD